MGDRNALADAGTAEALPLHERIEQGPGVHAGMLFGEEVRGEIEAAFAAVGRHGPANALRREQVFDAHHVLLSDSICTNS